jgi:pimeloyl-ACP methyl ester carboxylesterase
MHPHFVYKSPPSRHRLPVFAETASRWLAALLLLSLLPVFGALADDTSAPPVKTASVRVNGLELGYRTRGQGEPLLMIMGYAGVMDVWAPELVEDLSHSYRVIMFDNRGMGYSSGEDAPVSIRLMADDAAGLLEALHIESAHVLGWSMGSMVAMELAMDRPERVRKLVLYGSSIDMPAVIAAVDRMGAISPEALLPMLFPKAWVKSHPGIFSRLPAPSIAPNPKVIAKQRQALAGWSVDQSRLARIDKDVLLVVGEEDDVTPLAQGLRLAAIIPGAWVARFRGAGHWLMYQAPNDLARTVDGFVSVQENLLEQAGGR